jgi:septal ring factor EnvC (AmiA/AmiB activator)
MWLQALVACCVAAAASVFWAGNVNSRVQASESRIEVVEKAQKRDHDQVTTVDTKLDDLRADVADIKNDVKTLVGRK